MHLPVLGIGLAIVSTYRPGPDNIKKLVPDLTTANFSVILKPHLRFILRYPKW